VTQKSDRTQKKGTSNPTLPEITNGYEIQLHHSLGHDPQVTLTAFETYAPGKIVEPRAGS